MVISTPSTLTFIMQNVDSKVQEIQSNIHIVNSHSQYSAKLEAQFG